MALARLNSKLLASLASVDFSDVHPFHVNIRMFSFRSAAACFKLGLYYRIFFLLFLPTFSPYLLQKREARFSYEEPQRDTLSHIQHETQQFTVFSILSIIFVEFRIDIRSGSHYEKKMNGSE